jgi:EAL and modified HD-GYP domain-containing signal transduction protein
MNSYYIARQPILDAAGQTYGYELLFRSSKSNAYDATVDGNTATSNVLFNAIVEAGLETLVGKGLAFINLTNRFFENTELLELLPAGRCVLEVLETVDVTDEVVAGVQALRNRGHLIALDDFVDEERFARLLPLADIIKYDITQHSMAELAGYRQIDAAAGRRSLAERVETHEEHETLCQQGFDYFQGYFFAKPRIVSGAKLPQNRIALIQLIAEINNPDSTIDEVADIVGRDVSLGVRTLKYVNSPMNGLKTSVTSIRQAAVLLGRSLLRNWVTLQAMSQMSDQPTELIKLALTRARFCQLQALDEGLDDARCFTLGLLSLLDVFTSASLEDAVASVTLSDDMRQELLQRVGDGGRLLVWVEALEQGQASSATAQIPLSAGIHFQQASAWAEETSGLLN